MSTCSVPRIVLGARSPARDFPGGSEVCAERGRGAGRSAQEGTPHGGNRGPALLVPMPWAKELDHKGWQAADRWRRTAFPLPVAGWRRSSPT